MCFMSCVRAAMLQATKKLNSSQQSTMNSYCTLAVGAVASGVSMTDFGCALTVRLPGWRCSHGRGWTLGDMMSRILALCIVA